MSIKEAREQAAKKLTFKDSAPLLAKINALEPQKALSLELDGAVKIKTAANYDEKSEVYALARELIPWRKGPFAIDSIYIDSEWQSDKKFDIIAPHLNIENKTVGDIGCNNGYYLFRMLQGGAKRLIGFDPYVHYYLQFLFLQRFIDSAIEFELLGVEHLPLYETKFDTLLCLGVLYHRQDPIGMLKNLHGSLNKNGELIIDSIIIPGDEEICLCPSASYAKMRNVYFLPTLRTLQNWLQRAGFEIVANIGVYPTTLDEQRATQWVRGQSLEDFLDPDDKTRTVEGYSAPSRAYLKCRKKDG